MHCVTRHEPDHFNKRQKQKTFVLFHQVPINIVIFTDLKIEADSVNRDDFLASIVLECASQKSLRKEESRNPKDLAKSLQPYFKTYKLTKRTKQNSAHIKLDTK